MTESTAHKLHLAATDREVQGESADEGVRVGSDRLDAGVVSARTPNSPSADSPTLCICQPEPTTACRVHFPSHHLPPAPMDRDEFDRIVSEIYHRPYADPGRYPDMFAIALAQLGTFAVAGPGLNGDYVRRESAHAIRRMMRRVVDGETHIETEDHR